MCPANLGGRGARDGMQQQRGGQQADAAECSGRSQAGWPWGLGAFGGWLQRAREGDSILPSRGSFSLPG